MSNLVIAGIEISKSENGLYRINDLHKAAGGAKKHQPSDFFKLVSTKELVAEINKDEIIGALENQALMVVNGDKGGTYICRELVYAYAMWISPKFMLHVIRTFDALVTGQLQMNKQDADMLRITRINPNTLKAISGTRNNNEVRENYKALIDAGFIEEDVKIIRKRIYLPTQKGLDYVKISTNNVMLFKSEYHEVIVEAVNEYKEKLMGDNIDLFLD